MREPLYKKPNNICAHCNAAFSCGCQKISGIDGKIVHKTCKPDYDIKLTTKEK